MTTSSIEERQAGLEVGGEYRIVSFWDTEANAEKTENSDVFPYVGRTCRLSRTDRNDPRLTFSVDVLNDAGPDGERSVEHRGLWVYRLGPVLAETEALSEADQYAAQVCAKVDEIRHEGKKQDVIDWAVQTLIDQHAEMLRLVAEQRGRADRAALLATNRYTEHEAFKQQVREVAIRVAEEQTWCDNGLNEVLDELGLDRKEKPRYEVEVTVTYRFEFDHDDENLLVSDVESDLSTTAFDVGDPLGSDFTEVEHSVESVSCESVERTND